jgi:hypothetical protein
MSSLRSVILWSYCLLTALCWYLMWQQVTRLEAFRDHSAPVVARILSKTKDGDDSDLRVRLLYTVDGGAYSASQRVDRAVFESTKEGDPFSLLYLPGDPSQTQVRRVDRLTIDSVRNAWQIGLASITVVWAAVFGILGSAYGRQSRLLRHGIAVDARIISKRSAADGEAGGVIAFEFQTAAGESRMGYAETLPGLSISDTPNNISYFYLPSEPAFGMLLPQFNLVQIGTDHG